MFYRTFSSVDKITKELVASFYELSPNTGFKDDDVVRYVGMGTGHAKGTAITWNDADDTAYDQLSPAVRDFVADQLDDDRIRAWLPGEEFDLTVFQVRNYADDKQNAHPSQGFHQGGGDHVLVTVVAEENVNGAVHLLGTAGDDFSLVFERRLSVGETLLLDDRALTHHCTPFTPMAGGRAQRDVIVVSLTRTDADD
ncbi:2OG-Fe dioxygenase family protein [Nonomuraea sp. SYSU D8015]|uniref:2OG-Fe dioxygenase family protein n=1 Tax=Nonomuraea sp. SYSU D8015 TaxID=2593644 RepID=UPI00166090C6|nr:2OG-Fe dioxygenase family protein [Nonomuraea sp. SYSU D8015]